MKGLYPRQLLVQYFPQSLKINRTKIKGDGAERKKEIESERKNSKEKKNRRRKKRVEPQYTFSLYLKASMTYSCILFHILG